MYYLKLIVLACGLLLFWDIVQAGFSVEGELPRRAQLGFSVGVENNRLAVSEVVAESPAAAAGLRAGDIIVSVNDRTYAHDFEGRELLRRLDGGVEARLVVERAGAERGLVFISAALPFVDREGVNTRYGAFETSDGSVLRTALSRREGLDGPLAVVALIQWVSCGVVTDEMKPELLAVMETLPVAIIRVERTSSGDSEGAACYELDYDTEIRHYTEALLDVAGDPWVDRSRVYLYGSSLGSTEAPLVAQALKRNGLQVAGLMVQGGGGITYLERMITFDRINLERRDDRDFRAIHEGMTARIQFQVEYLVKGRHPDEIAGDSPTMEQVRGDTLGLGKYDHYGRPFAWHQQAARRDFLEAWLAAAAPTLVAYAEFDQFEGPHGHRMIVEVLNREYPGLAEFVLLPHINHFNEFHTDADQAYFRAKGVSAIQLWASHMVDWLGKQLQ
jgi:pimeloyl-ACP methyl ester carboxylesterase